jgi:hypothetical protein
MRKICKLEDSYARTQLPAFLALVTVLLLLLLLLGCPSIRDWRARSSAWCGQ